jgi:hypothetical protein
MLEKGRPASGREISSTASETCFLCSGVIWPGQETARAEGLTVHGHCYDRYIAPEISPD